MLTFRTSHAVNTTLWMTLLMSANITLQVDSADESSIIKLTEDSAIASTVRPNVTAPPPSVVYTVNKAVFAMAGEVYRAFVSTTGRANYTLIRYKTNPSHSTNVSIRTVPAGAAVDVTELETSDTLTMTFKTSPPTDSEVFVTVMEGGVITFRVDTTDPSAVVTFTKFTGVDPTVPLTTESTVISGSSSVRMTQSPTMQSAMTQSTVSSSSSVSMVQSPTMQPVTTESTMISGGSSVSMTESSSMHPKTMQSTISGSSSVSMTQSPTMQSVTRESTMVSGSSSVSMTQSPSMQPSTPQVVETTVRALSTQGPTVVRAFASTRSPANYTLIVYTRDPEQTVNVSMVTNPAGLAYDMEGVINVDPESLTVTFKTLDAVDTTVIVSLLESANVTFQVDTADSSSVVTLAVDLDMTTVQPSASTSTVSTEPSIPSQPMTSSQTMYATNQMTSQQTFTGSTVTAETSVSSSQTKHTTEQMISKHTSVEATMSAETSSSSEPVVTSHTMLPSDKMTSQVSTGVTMSSQPVVSSTPQVVETTVRALSTQGPTVIRAFASTRTPANYTLIIYTRDPEQTVNVSMVTNPAGLAYDMEGVINVDPESLTMTFKTSDAVDTTVIVTLLESANVTFQVDTADSSSVVTLAVDLDMTTVQPSASMSTVSTESSVPSQRMTSSQTMYATNQMTSRQTFTDSTLTTEPTMSSSQTMQVTEQMISKHTSVEATMSAELSSSSEPVVTSHTMLPSDKVTTQVSTGVTMSSQPVVSSTPQVVETTVRALSTQGPSVVKAFASTRTPANYTLIIYTRDPEQTVNVSMVTNPAGLAYDMEGVINVDPESLTMTFKTSDAVDTTVIVSLLESANVTFQVDTADPSVVELAADDGTGSTLQPVTSVAATVPPEQVTSSKPVMTSQTSSATDEMTSQNMVSTMSSRPVSSTQSTVTLVSGIMMTPTQGVETVAKTLSTQGSAIVMASVLAARPANYTLVIYTGDPQQSTNITIMTVPAGAAFDFMRHTSDDPEVITLTFRTSEAVDTNLIIRLLDSANISLQVETSDQSSLVVLAEDTFMTSMRPTVSTQMTTPPDVVQSFRRSLRTQGSTTVTAFASTRKPANYTLLVYIPNPAETVNISIGTDPTDLAYDIRNFTGADSNSLLLTFKTSEKVDTEVTIQLLESANISFQVSTADQSTVLELSEGRGIVSTVQPVDSTEVSTEPSVQTFTGTFNASGNVTIQACVSSTEPANYKLLVYTRNPSLTVCVTLKTQPSDVACHLQIKRSDDPELLSVILKCFGGVKATFTITVQESANITLSAETADPSTTIEFTDLNALSSTMQPMTSGAISTPISPTEPMMTSETIYPTAQMTTKLPVTETFSRLLTTNGSTTVKASVSTQSSATYMLVIYTNNPSQTANVSLTTSPRNASFDELRQISNNPAALTVTFKTSDAVNTTIVMNLVESAYISLQVDTADLSTVVTLEEDTQFLPTMEPSASTPMPTRPLVENITRFLSTEGGAVVRLFASVKQPSNYSVLIVSTSPAETVNITVESEPAGAAVNVRYLFVDDPEGLAVSFQTLAAANTTLIIRTLESSDIHVKVDTTDGSSIVELMEHTASTMQPTPMVVQSFTRSLRTQGSTNVKAFVSTSSPANYTLVIYIRNPERTANVSLVTVPSGVAFDVMSRFGVDPEALIMTFRTSEAVDAEFIISLLESANISFQVDTADQASSVVLEEDAGTLSTMQPSSSTTGPMVVISYLRTLATHSSAVVRGLVSTASPTNYTLIIYTRNPSQTVNVSLVSVPAGAVFDIMPLITVNPEALITAFKTSVAVDIDLIISLYESANISLRVDTADKSGVVVLTEDSVVSSTMQPSVSSPMPTRPVVESLIRSLTTEGSSTVMATVSTSSPANYTLIVYTDNAEQNTNLSLQTMPRDAAFDNLVFTKDDNQAVAMFFKTSEAVNVTILITVNGPANISLQVDTADLSSRASLIELMDIGTTTSPMLPTTPSALPSTPVTQSPNTPVTLGTTRGGLVEAYTSTRSPANFSLFVFTENPESVILNVETQPGNLQSNLRTFIGAGERSLAILFTVLEPANTTVRITLVDAANISLQVDTTGNFISRLEEVVSDVTTEHMVGNPSITGVTEVLNNQSTVFWNFDREDERFIQGFILQYRESHVSVYTNTSLIPASERNYTLTNLKPGTLYLLRLLAIDRDANPAAASFQKPVMTLSRDIMDPVPVTDQRSKPKMDSFHWILISSAALVILLLTIVIVGILIFTRKKPKRKPSGADDQTKEEHRV
ncbi:mucin-17-like isoform X2 [Acanthaster planci]|uniref:Mucin-17-like isoform X2 n=1 Tax=Acanthaster planci TaxID=133434 RepID=A0A8B7Z172_ACAPL|nr:mucin-17-like isoform X2 [Acanthaster planci]